MTSPERFLELATDVIRSVSGDDAAERARRSYKRQMRAFVRLVKIALLMLLSAIVIPVAMITAGLLLGPRGVEGLIAAPLAVLTAWAAILYFGLRKRSTPRTIAKSDLPQLPARTEEWLDQQRHALPAEAQHQVDTIALRLEALAPQVRALDPQAPAAVEIRRLLAEELPDLVNGYQKVPRTLQRQPLHDGPSPARRLVEGLATIDEEIGRMHTRLAADDLHTLATQQRFLEIKYKGDDEDEKR